MPQLDDMLPPDPPDESTTGRYRRMRMGIPPVDADPHRLHRWRIRLGLMTYSLVAAVGLIGMALITGLPLIGQVAWASEQDRKTDSKIAAAEARTSKQMTAIIQRQDIAERKLDEQGAALKRIAVDALEKRLKDLQGEICKTTEPTLKRRLSEMLDDGMREYRRTAGEEYRVRSCEVL